MQDSCVAKTIVNITQLEDNRCLSSTSISQSWNTVLCSRLWLSSTGPRPATPRVTWPTTISSSPTPMSDNCILSTLKHLKSVTFLDFWLSEGSVATYGRWYQNLCHVYIENFLTNHLVKKFWKSVHICQSYHQIWRGLLFLEHGVFIIIIILKDKGVSPANLLICTTLFSFSIIIINSKYLRTCRYPW